MVGFSGRYKIVVIGLGLVGIGISGKKEDPLGGLGGGLDGLGDMFAAETKCPVFECSEGEVAVQKLRGDGGAGNVSNKNWPFVYGCDKASFDMMQMLDPEALKSGVPKKKGNAEKLKKCCVGRDISQQVCGMTKAKLEKDFNDFSKKKCRGDKSCKMSANLGNMMSGGFSGDKCKEYNEFQKNNCLCVPKEKEEEHFASSVENFYKTFAEDKLPASGGTVTEEWLGETVYKKFKKDQKSEIWKTLLEKYSAKLEMKDRPKPDYGDLGGLGDLGNLGADKKKPSKKDEDEEEETEETVEEEL